ncbi:hypothetical protein BDN72DRAFT_964839 [Pluteus cervinus]|uniref:Uncharacterized protein n=1 Tax=Pluteus cervinus TaxID=181527 RepID=A0ACD3A8L8_9AGAR|nr:hypothetical protein BDN72DRAFT_964839 [Pluteus cervinus]
MDPCLPQELERIIFIYACHHHDQPPTNLFLVAKRVREWLLPIVFKVVIINRSLSSPIKFSSLHQFQTYGPHIQHFLLVQRSCDGLLEERNEYLAQCPNITNLAFWWLPLAESRRLDSILHMPKLTHLSITLENLLALISPAQGGQSDSSMTALPPHPPLFPNLTHLDLLRFPNDSSQSNTDVIIMIAREVPHLTHVTCQPTLGASFILKLILHEFKHLKALIWRSPGSSRVMEGRVSPVDDDRIVFIAWHRQVDWRDAATGNGLGIWEFADEVLAKRAEGKQNKAG